MKFVCARIMGGLGNQMFIYAAAKALSQRIGAKLVLDGGSFARDHVRKYALDSFGLRETRQDATAWASRLRQACCVLRSSMGLKGGAQVLRSRTFHVDERFFEIDTSCYLYGYWQSPRYFTSYEAVIRDSFDLQRFASPRVTPLLKQMAETLSVSVHLRRGDYASNPGNLEVHGLCGAEYYQRARALLLRCVPTCRFYVFSDELEAAREMFAEWPDTVFLSGNSQEEDLLLMSRCRHHIIANSSYSWWAAWLSPNPDKLVIAPRLWFSRQRMLNTFVLDLFPENWILL